MKWFIAQSLGLEHNGFLCHHRRSKLQCEPPKGLRCRWNSRESAESLLFRFEISRDAAPVERKSDWNSARCEQAHHTKRADPSARVAAQVDDQVIDRANPFDGKGDFVCNFNPNHARKHCNLEVAQPISSCRASTSVGSIKWSFFPLGRATSTETVRRWSLLANEFHLVCFPIGNTGCSGGVICRPSRLRRMSPGSMPAIAAAPPAWTS